MYGTLNLEWKCIYQIVHKLRTVSLLHIIIVSLLYFLSLYLHTLHILYILNLSCFKNNCFDFIIVTPLEYRNNKMCLNTNSWWSIQSKHNFIRNIHNVKQKNHRNENLQMEISTVSHFKTGFNINWSFRRRSINWLIIENKSKKMLCNSRWTKYLPATKMTYKGIF